MRLSRPPQPAFDSLTRRKDYVPYRIEVLIYDVLVLAMQLVYVVLSYDENHLAVEETEGEEAVAEESDLGSEEDDGASAFPLFSDSD